MDTRSRVLAQLFPAGQKLTHPVSSLSLCNRSPGGTCKKYHFPDTRKGYAPSSPTSHTPTAVRPHLVPSSLSGNALRVSSREVVLLSCFIFSQLRDPGSCHNRRNFWTFSQQVWMWVLSVSFTCYKTLGQSLNSSELSAPQLQNENLETRPAYLSEL